MARSSLRYVLPFALGGVALSGCGGGSSNTTGATPVTPETETVAAAPVASRPAPAPTPAPTSTPEPAQRQLVSVSFVAEGPGSVSGTRTGEVGTRGHATATPASGAQFLTWAASSTDCPGETTNPCSFSFQPNTRLVAQFATVAAAPPPAPVAPPAPKIDCKFHYVNHWNSGSTSGGYIYPEAQRVCPVPRLDPVCTEHFSAVNAYDSSSMRQTCARW